MARGFVKVDFSMFFDRKPVMNALSKAKRSAFRTAGSFVQRSARSSLRVARMKRLSELTPKERQRFRIRQAIAKRKTGSVKGVRRPRVPSRPGEPPRLSHAKSPLKKLLLFGYDDKTQSVVVGPMLLNPDNPTAPELMEEGGRGDHGQVAARPFMGPAMEANTSKIADLWRDAV